MTHPPPLSIARQPQEDQGLVTKASWYIKSNTPHSVGILWTSDRPVAVTSTWQHTTLTKTDIHAFGGIRANSPSKERSQVATGIGCIFLYFHYHKFVVRSPTHLSRTSYLNIRPSRGIVTITSHNYNNVTWSQLLAVATLSRVNSTRDITAVGRRTEFQRAPGHWGFCTERQWNRETEMEWIALDRIKKMLIIMGVSLEGCLWVTSNPRSSELVLYM